MASFWIGPVRFGLVSFKPVLVLVESASFCSILFRFVIALETARGGVCSVLSLLVQFGIVLHVVEIGFAPFRTHPKRARARWLPAESEGEGRGLDRGGREPRRARAAGSGTGRASGRACVLDWASARWALGARSGRSGGLAGCLVEPPPRAKPARWRILVAALGWGGARRARGLRTAIQAWRNSERVGCLWGPNR